MMVEFAQTVASNGLIPGGIGGGLNHETGKHKVFGLSFSTDEKIKDVNHARTLFVETADAFINFINAREDIQEFLDVFPVTILNIDIGIIFSNAQPGDMVDVFNCGARLCYYLESENPGETPWRKIHEETFEEAQAFVQNGIDLIQRNFQ